MKKANNNTETEMKREVTLEFVGTITGYALVALVILIGNLICLVVFLRSRRMRRRTHLLLVSLSVVDFLVGVSIIETISLELTTVVRSKVVPSTLYFLAGPASLFMLAAIAVERFIVTVFPLYYHRNTGIKLYVALIGFPWLTSCSVLIVFILGHKVHILPPSSLDFARILVPVGLIIIIVSYVLVAYKLKCHPAVKINGSSRQSLRDRKLAATLLIVTLLSLITWTPYSIFITILSYCQCNPSYAKQLAVALNWLKYLNSGINVFVYLLKMPEFKRGLLKMCCGNSVGVEPTSIGSWFSSDQHV